MINLKSNIHRGILIILAAGALVLVVLFWNEIGDLGKSGQREVRAPKDLILGKKIDAQVSGLPDDGSIDFALFNTERTREELVDFYTNKFNEEGWTIIVNRIQKSGNYLVSAQKGNEQVDVTIYAMPLTDAEGNKGPVSASVGYRRIFEL